MTEEDKKTNENDETKGEKTNEKDETKGENTKSRMGWVGQLGITLQGIIVVYFGIAALAILFKILGIFGEEDLLENLKSPEYARGLITVLFSTFTILLATILLLVVLVTPPGDEQAEVHYKARFNRGKDVLAVLIGILGTIIGYYFGITEGEDVIPDLEVVGVSVSEEEIGAGESIKIWMYVDGVPPFEYTINFDDILNSADITVAKESYKRVIEETIQIPIDIEDDSQFGFVGTVTDGKNRSVTFERKTGEGILVKKKLASPPPE